MGSAGEGEREDAAADDLIRVEGND